MTELNSIQVTGDNIAVTITGILVLAVPPKGYTKSRWKNCKSGSLYI